MNLNESDTEIALIVEELERLAVEVEERRAKERVERVQKGEVVFVRPSKVREVVYEYFSLHNHFEAKKFMKKLSTNSKKLEFYVNSIVTRVCEFFKQYNLYRKPVSRELIERVVDYYANVVITNRRVYVITKNSSKRKHKVRAPTLQTQLVAKREGEELLEEPIPQLGLYPAYLIVLGKAPRGLGPKAATQGREKALGAKALE
jgi:hypothetical protein